MFKIETDAAAALVTVTLSGFWDSDELASYREAMAAAISSLGPSRARYRCLCDCRALAVQDRDVIDELKAFIERPDITADRTAIIVNRALLKLQAKRILPPESTMYFEDMPTGRAWLIRERPPLS